MVNNSSGSVAVTSLHGQRLAPDGSKLVLVEWTLGGASSDDPQWMAPLHIHNDDDEAWYVLEGRLRVRVGDEDHDVPAGGAVLGPRGVPHTFCNPGPEPARIIVVMSDRTSALIDMLHSGKNLEPDEMRDLYASYGCQLLD
jgi:mannose-6-phosphate isomerase-like protein (cupin superfamily)